MPKPKQSPRVSSIPAPVPSIVQPPVIALKSEAITLQFVGEGGFDSDIISWFSAGYRKRKISHVDAVLDNGWLLGSRDDNPGGYGTGVRIRPPDYMRFSRVVRMALPVYPEVKAAWLQALNDQIGDKYDSKAIWGFALGEDLHTQGDFICSALQAYGIHKSGAVPTKLFLPDSRITPIALGLGISFAGAAVVYDSIHAPTAEPKAA